MFSGIVPKQLVKTIFFYGGMVATFLGYALTQSRISWLLLALGALVFTLVEYILHRAFFHVQPWSRYISPGHDHFLHHGKPRIENTLFIGINLSLPIILFLFAMFWLATRDFDSALFLESGFILAYLYFECLHYRIHFGNPHSPYPWVRWQIANHLRHHHSEPNRCYGLTTGLWDFLLQTKCKSAIR